METLLTRIARLAVLLAPMTLAACTGGKTPTFYCPRVAVLQEASHFVAARGDSADVADRTLDARITGVAGACKLAGHDMERVDFRIGFAATNGPASTLTRQTLHYFIAITQGDRIIDKKIFPITFDFKGGADQAVASTTPIRLRFPRAARSAGQQVLVGFQMTPAEITRATGEAIPTR